MKKMIVSLIAMIIIISSGGVVWAAQTDYAIGQIGGSELKLGLGARPVAMGEAFVGLADDVNALAWNPSGLGQISNYQVGFMHNIYIQETSQEYLAYAQPLFEGAGLGINMTYLNYGTFEKVDFDGTIPEVVGEFTPYVMTFAAGYGQWIMPGVAVGGAVKFISQSIDTETYSAVAVDLGGMIKPGIEGLQIGLAVQNLGTQLADADLPMNAKAGVAYLLPVQLKAGDIWRTLLDVNLPFGDTNYTSANIGTEYIYNKMVALRVGYKIKDTGDLEGVTGLTAGVGLQLNMFHIDYAMLSYGDLGISHQIALTVNFL
ncbi:PorV/PorQ family protein [bacterium]|nr:PorV/PorQ family protein [bacterium]